MVEVNPERLAQVRSIPLFSEVSEQALEQVLECMIELEVAAGHVLVEANHPGAGMFVLEEGTVAVEGLGRPRELGPGEFFGELALLDPRALHTARVQARTAVRCLAIGRDDFERMLGADPHIATSMLGVLARRLVDATKSGG